MTTYIAILRGINVSGQKLIKMEALRKSYENLGFINIITYLQSGNVVFTSKKSTTMELAQLIKEQIKKDFDFDIPILVLTIEDLQQIIGSNPFAKDKDNAFLHITFLFSNPQKFDRSIIEEKKISGEEIYIAANAVYLYCPNGYGKSKMSNNFLETKLKVVATTRNWKSSNEILKIAQENIELG